MPVTNARRNEYSKKFNFRLPNAEAEELDKRLHDENLTLPQFIREAMKGRSRADASITKRVGANSK